MDGECIQMLYRVIMAMCDQEGYVAGLSGLVTAHGWHYGHTHERLTKLERRGYVRVLRRGGSRKLIITPSGGG